MARPPVLVACLLLTGQHLFSTAGAIGVSPEDKIKAEAALFKVPGKRSHREGFVWVGFGGLTKDSWKGFGTRPVIWGFSQAFV